MVIRLGKPERFSKSLFERRIRMGQGCPKYYENNPNRSTGLHELSKRESARQAQRRPSEHKPNCNMAKAMRRYDKSVSQPTKKTRVGLKKERPMSKQNPA